MNPVVYDWFRGRMAAGITDVPFYETQGIMLQQKELPEMWATMEVSNPGMLRLCVGEPALWREFGSLTVVFLGKSGRGVRDLLVQAQAFADTMRENYYQIDLVEDSGTTGTLRVETIGSPEPDPYEDGNWMLCSVTCSYTYDSVRGAAPVSP